MSLSTITARVDERDKFDFDCFCNDVGMTPSTAINMFIKAVLREKKLPFSVYQKEDPFYSASNMENLKKSISQLKAGKGQMHDLIEDDDHE